MTELLIGCGNNRDKKIRPPSVPGLWEELVTLDIDPSCSPDVVHDIASLPLPFPDNHFDEIHAYDVLEHVGAQGDWRFFFAQWDDFYRMLKPGGRLVGCSPSPKSAWAFGDPGHTRVLAPEMFVFLDRTQYAPDIGKTAMTDYRPFFRCDFDIENNVAYEDFGFQMIYILRAVKPAR